MSKGMGLVKIRKKDYVLRWNYVKENPHITLSNRTSLDSDKPEVVDLAFRVPKAW
jgi:hypothetical protein